MWLSPEEGSQSGKWAARELGRTGRTGGQAWGEKIWKSQQGRTVHGKH